MNDTIKPPAFDSIPVSGGPAALLDIPRAAPAAATPIKPMPRQTLPVPPLPEPPALPRPALPEPPAPPKPALPVGIAPEAPPAPAEVDVNPMAGSPPPKASIFSGLLWDLLRPNRAKVAVLAGLGSLAVGAFGLNLLVPQFHAATQQQHAKAKESAKESGKPVAPEAPPSPPPIAPAPLPKPPADGGWNPIVDAPPHERPKPADHSGLKVPGGLDLPPLPTEDPRVRRVSHENPSPAPLPSHGALPALPSPGDLPAPGGLPSPGGLSLPAIPGAPSEPLVAPMLPGAGGARHQDQPPLPALPGGGSAHLPEPIKPAPLPELTPDKKPLPELKPATEVKPTLPALPGGDLPPLGGGGLPLLPDPHKPEAKPLPLPGGLPGAVELPVVLHNPKPLEPVTPKPLEPVTSKPLELPPLPGAGGTHPELIKSQDAKPAHLETFPGALPPLTPSKPDPVIGAGAIGAPPAPPAAGFPTSGPGAGPAAVLQPPLSESKTDFDVDIHRPANGDTYATVSKSFYGSPQYAAALQAFNRNLPISRVAEVQVPPVHVIRKYGVGPAVEQVRGEPSSRPAPAGSDEPLWGPPGAAQAGQVVYTSFQVPRKGMTLRDVAKVFYGSEANWSRLNNSRNPRYNPDEELPVGTQLYVPTELLPLR